MANVCTPIFDKQSADDTGREMSDNQSEDGGVLTLSSDNEEDNLAHQQEFWHVGQACRNKTLQTPRVVLPKKWSCADTVIPHTPLPHAQKPARVIAPQLLKCQKSTINILHESDLVSAQALHLPKPSGDQNIPQPKAVGDHNIPQQQQATFAVAKLFMEPIVFTKTPWLHVANENHSMVDEAWRLPIDAHDHQRASGGAPVDSPSVCPFPGGPSLEIIRKPEK